MIIPVVYAAIFLGRAFDMKSMHTTSKWIFEVSDDNKLTFQVPFTKSEYRIVETSSDIQSALDVNGELSIKAKSGKIELTGSGAYFSEKIDRDTTVELLMTVNHRTEVETMPSYIGMLDEWTKLPANEVGTHYIRSIIYGGQLFVSYQLRANSSENLEEIKAAVNAHLEVAGSVDADVKGKLEKIDKAVGSKSTLFIRAYGTLDTIQQPQTLEDTFKLIDEYPSLVKKINEGKGAPIEIELVPLSTLHENFGGELQFQTMNEVTSDAMDKMDDLRNARDKYTTWINYETPPEEMEEELAEYETRLQNARKAMSIAVADLDLSKPMDKDHFDEAVKKYAEGGFNIPHRYTRELEALIHKAHKTTPKWYPYTRAATHYIHWGRLSCTLPSPEPLVVGIAASSPTGYESYPGNGANLQCLGLEPKLDTAVSNIKLSAINGLSLLTPDGKSGTLFCAHCKLENATTAVTVIAQEKCPVGMKLEYPGYLATGFDGITESVCIDLNPDKSPENVHIQVDETANVIKPMWIKCDNCDDDEPEKYIPCVVCSR